MLTAIELDRKIVARRIPKSAVSAHFNPTSSTGIPSSSAMSSTVRWSENYFLQADTTKHNLVWANIMSGRLVLS